MQFVEAVKGALAKAKFQNKDVESALDKVLDTHKQDLNDVGYEPSTDTEEAIKGLTAVLDEVDEAEASRKADLQEAVKESREDDDTEQS